MMTEAGKTTYHEAFWTVAATTGPVIMVALIVLASQLARIVASNPTVPMDTRRDLGEVFIFVLGHSAIMASICCSAILLRGGLLALMNNSDTASDISMPAVMNITIVGVLSPLIAAACLSYVHARDVARKRHTSE